LNVSRFHPPATIESRGDNHKTSRHSRHSSGETSYERPHGSLVYPHSTEQGGVDETLLILSNLRGVAPPCLSVEPSKRRLHILQRPVPQMFPTRVDTQTPDRFVLPRTICATARDLLIMGKHPAKLSVHERLLRRMNTASDAFHDRPRPRNRAAEQTLPRHVSHDARLSLFRPDGVLTPRPDVYGAVNQHFDSASAWNAAGSQSAPPAGAVVADGRGGFLGAGTNAPMIASRFLKGPIPDLEIYERRLAHAFDIDQTNKVFGQLQPSLLCPQGSSGKITWKDCRWVREGSTRSTSCLIRGHRSSNVPQAQEWPEN